jgi:hypothetical protein
MKLLFDENLSPRLLKDLFGRSMIFSRLLLCAFFFTASCASGPNPHETAERISWREAVALIQSGAIERVFQAHSLDVSMRGRDGREYRTREPRIDAAWKIIQASGYDIRYATE